MAEPNVVLAYPVAVKPGRMNAQERIDVLFDRSSFVELGAEVIHHKSGFGMDRKRPRGDGVITGFGLVGGHRIYAYSQDRAVFGGALGEAHAQKIMRVQDMAVRDGAPLISFCDSGGARIQEGVDALAGYGGIFRRHVRASGRIPQIAVVAGMCAGGAAYGPALCDLIVMVQGSTLFLTGPKVVEAVCQESVSPDDLGGARLHAEETGLAHVVCPDDFEAIRQVQTLVRYFVEPNLPVWRSPEAGDPAKYVPADGRKVYNMRKVIEAIVDAGSLFELQPRFADNLVTGFARIEGVAVGVVANNPLRLGGVLNADAARKGARFVRLCDRFGLPIVTLVDVPGFLPGTEQERGNVIGHGSKLLYAYCESEVPKVSVVFRKAFGGAYIVMGSRSVGGDYCFAWPQSEIAVLGKQGAAEILFAKDIAASANPAAAQLERQDEYARLMLNPYRAAESGHIDAVIQPTETRQVIASCISGARLPSRTGTVGGNINL